MPAASRVNSESSLIHPLACHSLWSYCVLTLQDAGLAQGRGPAGPWLRGLLSEDRRYIIHSVITMMNAAARGQAFGNVTGDPMQAF